MASITWALRRGWRAFGYADRLAGDQGGDFRRVIAGFGQNLRRVLAERLRTPVEA